MPCPREIVDALESILGIYFSGIRHRERAAFILTDELVEMACKLRAKEGNSQFNTRCGFREAWNAPGVQIPANPLGDSIQRSHETRNHMQHANAAATVDDQHCADAILDAIQVMDHCWPGTSDNQIVGWKTCALRIVRLYSTQGDPRVRPLFEDSLRDGEWRAEKRYSRVNEFIILPGRRQYWALLIQESQVQVEALLNGLGVP
jgi:hypothetical protein